MSDLQSVYDALVQAKDCINGETPEDITFGEAEDDTLSKIRDAMRTVEALLNAPAQQKREPVAWWYEWHSTKDGWQKLLTWQKPTDHELNRNITPLYACPTPPSRPATSASSACPICGKDTPHAHYNDEAEIELFARPTFEFQLGHWLGMYLPSQKTWRGAIMGIDGWSRSWRPQRSSVSPPDYVDTLVEAMWGFWLDAWLSKPSWCNANDGLANQKQIERQTSQPAAAFPSTECATPPDEIERLRTVAWAAQGMLNADTYVSDVPREQAVREATFKLQQALGTWQMHHTAKVASAHSRSKCASPESE